MYSSDAVSALTYYYMYPGKSFFANLIGIPFLHKLDMLGKVLLQIHV